MTDQFRVGDIVECVDDAPSAYHLQTPIRGALYTVSDVLTRPLRGSRSNTLSTDGVRIHEIPSPYDYWWWAGRFRLIRRPRADAFSDLLNVPVDLRSEVDA